MSGVDPSENFVKNYSSSRQLGVIKKYWLYRILDKIGPRLARLGPRLA